MRKFNAIRNAVNFGKGKSNMSKFNESIQVEETTEFQENQVMEELNNEQQFTSMAHKRRVERLQESTQEDKDRYLTKYIRAFKHTDNNWICTIDEHTDPSEYPKFVAAFEDKLSDEYHVRRCGTIQRCGEWLVDCLEHHYEVIVPQYDLGNDNFATRQLEAEDAIDGFAATRRTSPNVRWRT